MTLIDSHCHPQFPQYDSDREEVIRRALDGGVQMICVGTDLEKSRQAIELAEKYDRVWATVGVHPNDLLKNLDISAYEKLLDHPKVMAIGEIGLDYYRTKGPEKQEQQRQVFQEFIELATQAKFPLIIHSRNAFQATLDLLAASRQSLAANPGVIHSFTYTWPEAQQFLALGLHIGLNGIVTFPPSRKATDGQAPASYLDEVIINTPLDRILLETDAPYLAPVPNRGKRNEPLWVTEVAKKIAAVKNIPVEEVAAVTTANTEKLFNLNA